MAIAEVIKFEGPQDALVWKFPIEDFNATSQLINISINCRRNS